MTSFDLTQALIDFLRRWGELGPLSGAVLAAVFVAGALVPVPRTFLVLAAGVVFGLPAIPIIMLATTLGCVIAFLLARYLFAERLARAIARKPKLVAIMDAVDAEGWRIVALCRLASPIPSMVQSALFGLTRIGLWPYAWATFVFTIPQIALYAYLGAVGRTALLGEGETINLGIMAAGGVTFLVIVLLITRRVRASMRALEARRPPI
jgi:uncharacterized membrane protein YdjX (TVP38/TMEM64 family)